MTTKARIICLYLSTLSLSACMIDGEQNNYTPFTPEDYSHSQLYPDGYDTPISYDNQPYTQSNVVVPETYHVRTTSSPTPSKDIDKNWVSSQNPVTYTIEIAHDEHPATVAGALQKAPKQERTAEVKYQSSGKSYYQGLYGSYPNHEAAINALNALPTDVKQGAEVKTWGSVQKNLSE